jgi:hypothetical protein
MGAGLLAVVQTLYVLLGSLENCSHFPFFSVRSIYKRGLAMENEQVSENGDELKSASATSIPSTPQNAKNPEEDNPSFDITEFVTKAKEAKEQTGTIPQIFSGGLLGISILFIVTMAQMKLSLSLDIALVLFSLCIPIFSLEFLLNSFNIGNFVGNKKPFENLGFLFPLGYIFTFLGIFFFILHVIHIAAILFFLSPILILVYLFLIAKIQKWTRKWKKHTPTSGAAGSSSV